MLRNATWTLSNFCRGKPQPDFELVGKALSDLNKGKVKLFVFTSYIMVCILGMK